ncbi:PH domain-containing protein [Streptomyces sp. NBC_01775]|uniref:PH domain-containing protein n=2 Tax=unclassified Streptomyces TaxID=2593676 RepID=UPI002DD7BF02|nr:PH domain-containing protein [Streptomyces sp. NBC_01775]WSB77120.1 PH domain-containing protein [Streptomyces sp. NBC_01775]
MTSEHESGSGAGRRSGRAEGSTDSAEPSGKSGAGEEERAALDDTASDDVAPDEVGPDDVGPGHETADGTTADGTSPDGTTPDADDGPRFADRIFRSAAGMAGGVVLLALGGWLVTDAVIGGDGRTPWLALAGLLFAAPLVVAFTLRPAVFAGETRLRVRNPFRTVEMPWGTVESVRAGYSSEVIADGVKYQMWSIPVSLRARKKATRHNERVASGKSPTMGAGGLFGGRRMPDLAVGDSEPAESRATSDQAIDEIRELVETHGQKTEAQGSVAVRWSFEILVPALAGAILLAVLLATR